MPVNSHAMIREWSWIRPDGLLDGKVSRWSRYSRHTSSRPSSVREAVRSLAHRLSSRRLSSGPFAGDTVRCRGDTSRAGQFHSSRGWPVSLSSGPRRCQPSSGSHSRVAGWGSLHAGRPSFDGGSGSPYTRTIEAQPGLTDQTTPSRPGDIGGHSLPTARSNLISRSSHWSPGRECKRSCRQPCLIVHSRPTRMPRFDGSSGLRTSQESKSFALRSGTSGRPWDERARWILRSPMLSPRR